ncbi:hypothetical protein DSO57_1018709 [Entomophthora muscae]|uniref:Uncharacterized protein n=1 Tax=Entomophthora muscae TaxID=34485 RepID=A0ACC2UQ31_9FUNG|nr:hypothetical protein DSO57_1018709 [Entomophthora muscae]
MPLQVRTNPMVGSAPNPVMNDISILVIRSAFWGSFKYGIGENLGCGGDLVGLNLGVGHVRDTFEPLDTWIVM